MIEIYTDGACSGNPGPGGWGVLLRIDNEETELCGGEPATTNNRMELLAVIEALQSFTQPVTARVEDVHVSQRFFAGGSTSVRGWELDRLGAPDVLDANGLSNGGNGLVVLNGEARVGLTRDIGLTAFVDSGNVFSRVSAIDLGQLRWSAGAGVRYRSPIGPLRLDVAWKLGTLRSTDGKRWAFFITIGEAF
mgnify:CR=1 FL=1